MLGGLGKTICSKQAGDDRLEPDYSAFRNPEGAKNQRWDLADGRYFESPGARWRFTSFACPVQAEGTIDGHEFYFRARHNEWTFGVASPDVPDPVDVESPEQGFFVTERMPKGSDAGWMPLDQAKAIIERCIDRFIA